MKFKDKVAIITGAGKGIGRAIAMAYAAEGASVVIAEKDQVTGAEAEKTITSAGGIACLIKTDISRPEEIAAMIKKATGLYGTIDILVNNAGLGRWKPPSDLTVGEWDEVINTNLRGSFLCAREASVVMRQRGGGSIINIASTRALMSEPNSEAYAASKGGIVALTHALAASLAADKIRVNCISPGWIETGDYTRLRDIDHRQHFSGRVGKPDDIAHACLFLSSDENDFISGTNIIIDGGMTRRMIYHPV